MENLVQKHGEVISNDISSKISLRYHTITKAVNREFWNSSSDVLHSLYVGSYGRGTAIDVSDVDILITLPQHEYTRFDTMKGNGQSRLLQAVKNSIILSYPKSNIRADGQVIVIDFSDGIKFEVLPAFENTAGIAAECLFIRKRRILHVRFCHAPPPALHMGHLAQHPSIRARDALDGKVGAVHIPLLVI